MSASWRARWAVAVLLTAGTMVRSFGYVPMEGPKWPDGSVGLQLRLGGTPRYSDGANPNTTAQAAAQAWNPYMARMQLTTSTGSTGEGRDGNAANEVFFSDNIYGYSFGSDVLAVTLISADTTVRTETDVIVNQAEAWDSYRGTLQRTTADLRRVLTHEFGHVLGLGHANGDSLMSPYMGNIDAPTPDDQDGVAFLYGNGPGNPARPPMIVSGPFDVTVVEGHSAELSVYVTGSLPMTFQWRKEGVAIAGANTDRLALAAVTTADAGKYTVRVANAGGSLVSGEAVLTVLPLAPPRLATDSPYDMTVIEGRSVGFYPALLNPEMGPFTYQWRKGGVAIPGATESSFSIAPVKRTDAGDYSVVVANQAGSVTSRKARLTVTPFVAPRIAAGSPSDETTVEGQNATFVVRLENSDMDPFSYQWRKGGVDLPGETNSVLSLNEVKLADAGLYSVRVTNAAGSATSRNARLTVPSATPPKVTLPTGSRTVAVGDYLSVFPSSDEGTWPLTYQWERNGIALAYQTSPVLSLGNAKPGDSGTYTLTVTNPGGSVRSNGLAVAVTPALLPAPAWPSYYLDFYGDRAAKFSTSIGVEDSNGPFSIQWYHNGQPIPGATNRDYSMATPTAQSAGDFVVVVTSPAGSTVSRAVYCPPAYLSAAGTPSDWIAAESNGGVAYFLFSDPARIQRYDLATGKWLAALPLSRKPTAFRPTSTALYVAFGAAIVRLQLDGSGETPVATLPGEVRALLIRGSLIYVSYLDDGIYWRLSSVRASDGAVLATDEETLQGLSTSLSLAPGLGFVFAGDNRLMSRVLLLDGGGFGSQTIIWGQGNSDTPPLTIVLPDETGVIDTTSVVHDVASLGFTGSLGGPLQDVAFTVDGGSIVLRNSTLFGYDADLRERGRMMASGPATRAFLQAQTVTMFSPPATVGGTPSATRVATSQLAGPAPRSKVSAAGLAYTPSDVVVDQHNVVYLLDRVHGSLFRWSVAEGRYLESLPLSGAVNQLAYLPDADTLFATYADQRIMRLRFDGTPAEEPFVSLPGRILNVAGVGAHLFVNDLTFAQSNHTIYGLDGRPTLRKEVSNVSSGVTWSEANHRLFLFIERSTPDRIGSVDINPDGTTTGERDVYLPANLIRLPMRAAPAGDKLLFGSGAYFDPTSFEQKGALPFPIDDAAWLGSRLYTARVTLAGTRVDRWAANSTSVEASGLVPGRLVRLLPLMDNRLLAVVMRETAPAFVVLDAALGGANPVAPEILLQPLSTAARAGATTSLTVTALAASSFAWSKDGQALSGATGTSWVKNPVQPADAGIYVATVTGVGRTTQAEPAILGLTTTSKVTGGGLVVGTGVHHPNGNIFDQILVTGPAESITAEAGKVTRTSYVDQNDDIVQVEFSGAGTLSLVLSGSSGPAAPANFHQPGVSYMKGTARIVIAGADETTNVSIFTVGRATAFDPTNAYDFLRPISPANKPANNGSPLFSGHGSTAYDGVADLASLAILSRNGWFGGLRCANARFAATGGFAGIYAPGVQFTGPVFIGDIAAADSARPAIILGAASDAQITGGSLAQPNGRPVEVSGLTQLKFVDGTTSGGDLLPARRNQARLEQAGTDVTGQIVVDP